MRLQKIAIMIIGITILFCGCANEFTDEMTLDNSTPSTQFSQIEETTAYEPSSEATPTETYEQSSEIDNTESTNAFEPVGTVHTGSFLDFRKTDFSITIPKKDEDSIPGTVIYTAQISGRNGELPSTKIVYYAYADNGLIYRVEIYAADQATMEATQFLGAMKTILLKLKVVSADEDAQEIIDEIYANGGVSKINDTYYEVDVENCMITIMH